MPSMSRFAICLTALTLVACAKSEQAKDTTAAAGAVAPTPPAPPPAVAIKLNDVAGKWTIVSTPVDGKDTTVTTYALVATGDSTGWTRTNPGAKPVPVHVRTDGDSIIMHTGPFQSMRRKGQQVTSDAVLRLQGGKLVGTSTAHYKSTGPDSVIHLRLEGTKAP